MFPVLIAAGGLAMLVAKRKEALKVDVRSRLPAAAAAAAAARPAAPSADGTMRSTGGGLPSNSASTSLFQPARQTPQTPPTRATPSAQGKVDNSIQSSGGGMTNFWVGGGLLGAWATLLILVIVLVRALSLENTPLHWCAPGRPPAYHRCRAAVAPPPSPPSPPFPAHPPDLLQTQRAGSRCSTASAPTSTAAARWCCPCSRTRSSSTTAPPSPTPAWRRPAAG